MDLLAQWSAVRRQFYCTRGEHRWVTWGQWRVCSDCQREERRTPSGDWVEAPRGFATTQPTGVEHEPTNGMDSDDRNTL